MNGEAVVRDVKVNVDFGKFLLYIFLSNTVLGFEKPY